MISASNINDRGQISGMATVQSGPHPGDIHAYLLTPTDGRIGASMADFARTHPQSLLPANTCNHSLRRSDPAGSRDNGSFRSSRIVYSRLALHEGKGGDVRDVLGHGDLDVTRNILPKKNSIEGIHTLSKVT